MSAISGPHLGLGAPCAAILRALPDWFGMPESITQYEREISELSTFIAGAPGGPEGFLSVKRHTPYAAELYVMGVRPELHRRGLGRALVGEAERWLVAQGVEYLQVKTLAPSHPDPDYAMTRAFYMAVGFRPLEELPQLWGPANPCLLLVRRIGSGGSAAPAADRRGP